MADTYLTSPRRVEVIIKLHVGEVASIVTQPRVLTEYSDDELQKMIFELQTEQQTRGEKK